MTNAEIRKPESVRKKFRPDLLVIPTLRMHMSGQPACAPRTRRQRSAHKVYVIAVGYCSELGPKPRGQTGRETATT